LINLVGSLTNIVRAQLPAVSFSSFPLFKFLYNTFVHNNIHLLKFIRPSGFVVLFEISLPIIMSSHNLNRAGCWATAGDNLNVATCVERFHVLRQGADLSQSGTTVNWLDSTISESVCVSVATSVVEQGQ